MSLRIAVDVGGTFTDVVAASDTGDITFTKTPSTPADQSLGVMQGLRQLAGRLDMDLATLLGGTERIVHGMTVATNALLERKGARVGLLTTAGHRDVLEMREGLKPDRYHLRLPRPETLVPRHLRLGIVERMRADGSVHEALDPGSLEEAVAALRAAEVNSIAVCFLHAYRNEAHERQAADALARLMPDTYVSLSCEVLPQIKEYQRVSTTVVNAYVGPLIRRYLEKLAAELKHAGYGGPLLIMLSHGGVAPVDEAVRIAAATVLSGPAGGVAGARRVAGLSGVDNLIPLDMGGTSTDISLIIDGEAALATERSVGHQAIALPSLDIITLGAGGGSIAQTNPGGLFKVGPESAGAVPGPASYGGGGNSATVTDASVVLGLLSPDNFMGGSTELDVAAAERAVKALGDRLNLEPVEVAEGIHRVVNTHMAEGIRLATVRRGVDPRRFSLLGFGGAAGLHATALARMLSLNRVLVPGMASVLSAWGMLATELRFETLRSLLGETAELDDDEVRRTYDELAGNGQRRMRTWFDGEIEIQHSADMRYGEQVYEINVPFVDVDLSAADFTEQLKRAFEARHRDLYTYALPEQAPVLVNARSAAVGRLAPAPVKAPDARGFRDAGERSIYLGEWQTVPVHDFEGLCAGRVIDGPAMVESETTTVLLRKGDRATVTTLGWLDISIDAPPSSA